MYNTVVTKDFVSLYIEGYKLPKKELHLSKEREVDIQGDSFHLNYFEILYLGSG